MQNAVVTLSINMPETDCFPHAVMRAYAARHGMAFEVIKSPLYGVRPNLFAKRRVWYHVEKFQLHDLLKRYHRILYLDTDILVNPGCPDLLQRVPEGSLGCVYDDLGPDAWKRIDELKRLIRVLGPLPGSGWRYFNAGMMVLDRSHLPLFEMRRREFRRGRWPEQTLLNYRVIKGGYPLKILDSSYNFMNTGTNAWEDAGEREKAHMVHYAGQPAKQVMREDFVRVAKAWGLEDAEP